MEKICRICAAPMVPTDKGWKCSFCTYEEIVGEENPYERGVNSYTTTENTSAQRVYEKSKPILVKKNKWIIKLVIFYILLQFLSPLIMFLYGTARTEKFRDSFDIEMELDGIDFPEFKEIKAPNLDDIEYEISMPEIDLEGLDPLQGNYVEREFRTSIVPQIISEMFGNPVEEVKEKELQNIQYLTFEIDYSDCTIEVNYSTEDYHEYPEDYSKAVDSYEEIHLGYDDKFVETIKTITLPYNEWELPSDIYEDIAVFENVKAINLCDGTYVDFSLFPNLTMLDAGSNSVQDLLKMNLPIEQIEVLRLSTAIDLENLVLLTNLKNLHIDGTDDIITELDGLSNLPWLKELTIVNTYIMDVDFLYYMPRLENLRLLYNQDLDNLDGMQALEELVWFQIEY